MSLTEIGGTTPQSPKTALTPSEFEEYLRIAKEKGVFAFRLGDLAVQFTPDPGLMVDDPAPKTAGNWKRGPDLDSDPELGDWD